MKTCTKCGEEKPLESFNKHRGRKDGHDTQCKDCKRSALSAYYKENRDEVKEKQVVESFTKDELVKRWGDACMDCGAPFTDVDHVVPVVAGGPHTLENCQPICRACDLRRWRVFQRAAIAAYIRREQ